MQQAGRLRGSHSHYASGGMAADGHLRSPAHQPCLNGIWQLLLQERPSLTAQSGSWVTRAAGYRPPAGPERAQQPGPGTGASRGPSPERLHSWERGRAGKVEGMRAVLVSRACKAYYARQQRQVARSAGHAWSCAAANCNAEAQLAAGRLTVVDELLARASVGWGRREIGGGSSPASY